MLTVKYFDWLGVALWLIQSLVVTAKLSHEGTLSELKAVARTIDWLAIFAFGLSLLLVMIDEALKYASATLIVPCMTGIGIYRLMIWRLPNAEIQ